MRPSRGGPRARGVLRGGSRSADDSGDEAAGRKGARRVHFEDTNGATPVSSSRPTGAAVDQSTSKKPASAAGGSTKQNQSSNPRRGRANQRIYNNVVSQAARAPAALSRSFGDAPNPLATRPSASGNAQLSFGQRYQMLKRTRDIERQEAIANGFLADPDKPRTLAEAITPVGTCQDMCPEFERVERVVQNDVWGPELEPEGSSSSQTRSNRQQPDEARMVKKFRRAAAGIDEQLPSDLRPPHVLQRTIDYLFNDLIEQAESLASVHHFVWDRTRAIRNDFSIQQLSKSADLRIAIDCYERIARFHILSLHQLALPEKPYDKYDAQQEREQLDKTLLSLMQYYDDNRGRINSPNEPEFRAYGIIFQIQDPIPDLEERVQMWPEHIAKDGRVQRALRLYAAACNVEDLQGPLKPPESQPIAQGNWRRFWKLVESTEISYLASCVAEIYFPLMRRIALDAVWKAYRAAKRNIEDWTLDELMPVLGFEDASHVEHFCVQYGFTIRERDDGLAYLDLESVSGRELPDPTEKQKQRRSEAVEYKRYHRLYSAVINGMSVRAAKEAGMIEEILDEDEHMGEEQSLFIASDSDEETAQDQGSQSVNVNGVKLGAPSTTGLNPFASPWSPAKAAPDADKSLPTQPKATFGSTNAAENHTVSVETESGTSLFPSSISSQSAERGNPTSAPNQSTLADSSTATPAPVSTSSGLFQLFPKLPGQDSQPSSTPFLTPQSSTPPNSSQQPLFNLPASQTPGADETRHPPPKASAVFDAPAPPASAGPSGLFNFAPADNVASKATNPENRPFSFLGAKVESAKESHKFSSSPSLFAGTGTAKSSDTDSLAFNTNQNQINATTQESAPSKSLFDRISRDGNVTFPSTQESPKSETRTQNPNQSQPVPNNITLPSISQNLHPSPFSSTKPQPEQTPSLGPFTTPSLTSTGPAPSKPSSPFGTFQTPFQRPFGQGQSASPPSKPSLPAKSQAKSHQQIAQERAAEEAKRSAILDRLARSMVTDSFGFLEQYMEFTVGPMIKEARKQVMDEKNWQKAEDFRISKISQRYASKWREICWSRRVARQGRERRQRLAKDQEARARRSRESSINSALEDFRRSTNKSTDAQLAAVSPGEEGQAPSNQRTSSKPVAEAAQLHNATDESRMVSGSAPLLSTAVHRRSESVPYQSVIPQSSTASPITPSLHRSSLRRSFLPGDPPATIASSAAFSTPRSDTTRSNYFRLKALGIDPTGLTRPSDRKRPRNSDSHLPTSASPGKRHLTAAEAASPCRQISPHNQPPPNEAQKQAANDEDEELFAAVRQARQAMGDSISFFQDEIAKEEEMRKSRGSDGSPRGLDPPNAVASGHVSAYSSSYGAQQGMRGGEVAPGSRKKEPPPAYRNRVSKFLPREQYAYVRLQQQRQERDNPQRRDGGAASSNAQRGEPTRVGTPNVASSSPAQMERPALLQSTVNRQTQVHEEARRPQSKDNIFTQEGSFASSSNLNSSFTSPQQDQLPHQPVDSSISRPAAVQLAPSRTNGQTMNLYPTGHRIGSGIADGAATTTPILKSQSLSTEHSQGPRPRLDVKKHVVELYDDTDEEEEQQEAAEDADGFEVESSNPQRNNPFALLRSMADEDGDEEEDEEDDGSNSDKYFDDEGMTEEEEEEDGQEEAEDAEHANIKPQPVKGLAHPSHAPPQRPKPLINGKGGTSAEDAIEL